MWRDCRSAKRGTGCSPIRIASKASSCWCSRQASPGPHRPWRPNGCSKRCSRLWRRARQRGSLRALPGFQRAFCTARRSSAPSRIRPMDRLTLKRPDDWHLHLRDGPAMASVLADSARRFARAIVMPNLKPPVRTTQQALEYRERILQALPPRTAFEPLMTLYLTDDTPPEEITRAKLSGHVFGVKLYPAGATTHSDGGVTRLSRCFHALEKMTEVGMPLLIHGESTDPAIDIFDREKAFIEEVLGPLVDRFPQLKVVLEHITTRDAVQYIEVTGPNIAATITAHHLLMNRNALFMGGIRPHHYCLPDAAHEKRVAVHEQVVRGDRRRDVRTGDLDVLHRVSGGDVLEHDLELGKAIDGGAEDFLDEGLLAVENVDRRVGRFAMDQQRHADFRHFFEGVEAA